MIIILFPNQTCILIYGALHIHGLTPAEAIALAAEFCKADTIPFMGEPASPRVVTEADEYF